MQSIDLITKFSPMRRAKTKLKGDSLPSLGGQIRVVTSAPKSVLAWMAPQGPPYRTCYQALVCLVLKKDEAYLAFAWGGDPGEALTTLQEEPEWTLIHPVGTCPTYHILTPRWPSRPMLISQEPTRVNLRELAGKFGKPTSGGMWLFERLLPRRCPSQLRVSSSGDMQLWIKL